MEKITVKIPKPRNALAFAVLDPKGAFRPKSEVNRKKYSRKVKHSKKEQ